MSRRTFVVGSALLVACSFGVGEGVGVPHRAARPPQASPAPTKPTPQAPADLRSTQLRVRVVAVESSEPALVAWRHGGEGLGGKTERGHFKLAGEDAPLAPGEWSDWLPLASIFSESFDHDAFVTLTVEYPRGPGGDRSPARLPHSGQPRLEVEHRTTEALLRRFEAKRTTVTLVVPGAARDGYVDRVSTTLELARARNDRLRALPWADWPLPTELALVSDLGGFGDAPGRGVRFTDPDQVSLEVDSLQQLGVNGLRSAPAPLVDGSRHWRARLLGSVGFPVEGRGRGRDNPRAGCAFADSVEGATKLQIDRVLSQAAAQAADQVWVLTRDEITPVSRLAIDKSKHLSSCDNCQHGYVQWLKARQVAPRQLGAASWTTVRPVDQTDAAKPWNASRQGKLNAYLTREFSSQSTAKLFTPLRDALRKHNEQAPDGPQIYSYALRGNTFLTVDNGLDFFEFYRHADNAVVWETSNRDARAWPWDSYLTDVQRVLQRELGLRAGIYVKPHRGAPVQRALAAVSRGNSLIYWYTFGPEYWKGDAFTSRPRALDLASKAAHLLGRADGYLEGATLAEEAQIALVKPDTTSAWAELGAEASAARASLEDAKWVYTALQHSHASVDPLDEGFLERADLRKYKLIYVLGTHVRRTAARALSAYVAQGGVLITGAGGLSRDEADEPLTALSSLFGVSKRSAPELWCPISAYGATQLQSLSDCKPQGKLTASGELTEQPLVVGREVLHPSSAKDVAARFEDGTAAVVVHSQGRGRAILLGTFSGLEYASPVLRPGFRMREDFQPSARARAVGPGILLDSNVNCSEPLVEAVALRSREPTRAAVTLSNWAYADMAAEPQWSGLAEHVKLQPLGAFSVHVRGFLDTQRVRSAARNEDLSFRLSGDGIDITVPSLEEGDILLLDRAGRGHP